MRMTIGNIGNCPYAIFGVGAKKGLDMNTLVSNKNWTR